MIVIENGDKIRGDATTAAEVDCTIYGLDNNALKQLADAQLANSIGDLYTADSTDVVTAIILVNTGAAHNHCNLYLTPSGGTARRLIPKDLQLESGYSLHFEGGKCVILTNSGEIAQTIDTSAFLDDTVGGTDALITKAPTSNAFYDHTQKTDTHGATGAIVGTTNTQELDNKTFDSSVGKGTWTASGTWTLPAVTCGGDVTFAENVSIALDPALSADTKWCGITETGTAGTTALVYGFVYYLATATSKWELTDASAEATAHGKLGMCVVAANTNAVGTLLLWGKIRADDEFPTLTIGDPVFLGETAGEVVTTAPATAASITRVIGQANTGDELFFCPSPDWFEHA